ncbi:aspartic peptidase A1 [Russula compacta]|nr:aspartic peptidase A1 [Russula compacta]
MLLTVLLTCPILSALSVAANPIVIRKASVSLPFARQLNVTGSNDLLLKDQARARNLVALSSAQQNGTLSADAIVSLGATNAALAYRASVGVGSPATSYTLIIDTGSANTWVGAGKAYVRTSTSVQTSSDVSIVYGSGKFSGVEFTDTVAIAPGIVIPQQSIGVALASNAVRTVDGILGLGPRNLTISTLSPSTGSSIPTVTDNLFSQGTIASDLVSVSFEPTNTTLVENGELTFGNIDSTKFTGGITYTPVTRTFPASAYWGIDQSISYGTSTPILTTTAGIVDTGTALILIASDAFNRYVAATGAVLDSTTGLLRITPAQYANLQSLFFTAGGTIFELTANAQIWPRALNTFIGGTAGNIYLIVNSIGSPTGQGLDFINGYTFLERFYSVFDTGNRRVGFATTPFTTATNN